MVNSLFPIFNKESVNPSSPKILLDKICKTLFPERYNSLKDLRSDVSKIGIAGSKLSCKFKGTNKTRPLKVW